MFVLYNPTTKHFLRRVGPSKRKWVEDLDDATTWMDRGHAKNAARHVWEDKLLGMTEPLDVVEVALQTVSHHLIERRLDRRGHVQIVTVDSTTATPAKRIQKKRR